ncbi:TnsA endonuclease C-terminal domain-containing protein [Rhodomicrobium udaipurense]|uniref:TnsA endonuclease C-terminal domain-containing protein n=1 Tax=Rhodomicrobium udaipurense TaxID=1202716 RepID=UPI001AED929A
MGAQLRDAFAHQSAISWLSRRNGRTRLAGDFGRRSGTRRQFCADIDEGFSLERGTALMLVRHLLARKKLRFPIDEPLDDGVALERFIAHRVERLRWAL